MRLYHTAYRRKNPAKRAGLRGNKKKLHSELMRVLKPVRRNPGSKPVSYREAIDPKLLKKRGLTKAVEAFNLLGRINVEIKSTAKKAGDRTISASERRAARKRVSDLLVIRDTVEARIAGNIDDENLEYALEEALKDLNAAEVRSIQKMLAAHGPVDLSPEKLGKARAVRAGEKPLRKRDIKGPDWTLKGKPLRVTPSIEGAYLREKSALDPDVQRIRSRVDKLQNLSDKSRKMFENAIKRRQLSVTEWSRGPERHKQILEAQAREAEEMGDRFEPADEELWTKVEKALIKKHGEYIPPRLKETKKKELALLIEMNHAKTSKKRQKEIRKALESTMRRRLRNRAIVLYEKAGGKGATRLQREERKRLTQKAAETKKQKALGQPFKVGDDRYGVIDKKGKNFVWALFDSKGTIYLSGKSANNRAASKNVGIAQRIDETLTRDKAKAGWDSLPANDRRWLENNKPDLSAVVARKLLKNINKRVKVSKTTALWIAKAAELGTKELSSTEMLKTCEGMTFNETREFRGKRGAYTIHVRRGRGKKYAIKVVMKDGRESASRRVEGCDNVLKRAHALAGSMMGAEKVAKAAKNPGKIRRLNADARRYFAKQNPKLPRQTAEEADIKELAGMIRIPDDNEEAFRYGLYFGIIRGIDTCGLQNFFQRRRIRKTYQQRLIEGAMAETARAAGISMPTSKVKRKKKKKEDEDEELTDDTLEELAAKLSG